MRKPIIILVLVILAIILLTQSLYVVDETKQAIVLQFGEYQETVTKPGIHVKLPFLQTVKQLDKRILTSGREQEKYVTLAQEGAGVDIRLSVDHVTRWRISDPKEFYVSFRGREETAKTRLQGIVVDALKAELASRYWVDIISSERETIINNVTEKVAAEISKEGIEVIDVRIKRADLPEEVEQGVFDRVIAEREAEAKKAEAEGKAESLRIEAKADRDVTIALAEGYKQSKSLKGEGDAIAAALYAAAYQQAPQFYSLLRTLEVYNTIMGGETTLVLSTESDLFKYLSGSEPQE